jgi:hypothetical protein
MVRYQNSNGNSGVIAYEIGQDFIRVLFSDDSIYRYTKVSAGAGNIEHMKSLAINGIGLNSYINTTVRMLYARKER